MSKEPQTIDEILKQYSFDTVNDFVRGSQDGVERKTETDKRAKASLIAPIAQREQAAELRGRKKGVRDGYNYALTDVDLATSLTDAYHRVHEGHKKAIEACRG